uniref:Uncharacterized protein n=1 Tax=Rhizophora mucronata TaxID=61149 RepID=A0A2P2PE02_RHIMU
MIFCCIRCLAIRFCLIGQPKRIWLDQSNHSHADSISDVLC